jgi:hypothetical protein
MRRRPVPTDGRRRVRGYIDTVGSHICAEFVHSLIDTDFIQYSACQMKLDTWLTCTDKMHFCAESVHSLV